MPRRLASCTNKQRHTERHYVCMCTHITLNLSSSVVPGNLYLPSQQHCKIWWWVYDPTHYQILKLMTQNNIIGYIFIKDNDSKLHFQYLMWPPCVVITATVTQCPAQYSIINTGTFYLVARLVLLWLLSFKDSRMQGDFIVLRITCGTWGRTKL